MRVRQIRRVTKDLHDLFAELLGPNLVFEGKLRIKISADRDVGKTSDIDLGGTVDLTATSGEVTGGYDRHKEVEAEVAYEAELWINATARPSEGLGS